MLNVSYRFFEADERNYVLRTPVRQIKDWKDRLRDMRKARNCRLYSRNCHVAFKLLYDSNAYNRLYRHRADTNNLIPLFKFAFQILSHNAAQRSSSQSNRKTSRFRD